MTEQRKTRDGQLIVDVNSLTVGDVLRFDGGGMRAEGRILWIDEKPKTRRVGYELRFASSRLLIGEDDLLMRRTTLVARKPREGEAV